jgi:hypothetical protein
MRSAGLQGRRAASFLSGMKAGMLFANSLKNFLELNGRFGLYFSPSARQKSWKAL